MIFLHLLRVKNSETLPMPQENPQWITLLLLLLVLLTGLVWAFYRRRLGILLQGFYRRRLALQLFREERAFTNGIAITLLINFVLVFALFIYQVIVQMGIQPAGAEPMVFFLEISLAIVIVYTVKIITIKIIAFIFRAENVLNEYIFNILLVHQVMGLILLPLVTAIALMDQVPDTVLIYTGVVLVGGAFVYRLFRGMLIGNSARSISAFYLFLYLCTLEFLPLVIVVKLIGADIG